MSDRPPEVALYRRQMNFDFSNQGIDDMMLDNKQRFVDDDLLEGIDLRGNRISDQGLGIIVNLATSEKQKNCRKMDISNNPLFTEVCARPILTMLRDSTLVSLKLTQLEGVSSAGWRQICDAFTQGEGCKRSLEEVVVSKNKRIDSAIFVQLILSLQDYRALTSINVSECGIDKELAGALQDKAAPSVGKLNKLVLSQNPLGDAAATLFKWLPKTLTHVELDGTALSYGHSRKLFEALSDNDKLELLNLNNNEGISMYDLGTVMFAASRGTKLRVLKIRHCFSSKEESDSRRRLKGLMETGLLLHLVELDLSSNYLHDEFELLCATVVAKSTTLHRFSADRCNLQPVHVQYFANAVMANKDNKLRFVDWNKNFTRDEGCDHWRIMLKDSKLEGLSLIDNEIDARGGETLLCALWDDVHGGKLLSLNLGGSSTEPPRGNRIKFEILRDITVMLKARRDEADRKRIEERRVRDKPGMPRSNFGAVVMRARAPVGALPGGPPPPSYETALSQNQTQRPATLGSNAPVPAGYQVSSNVQEPEGNPGFFNRPAGFTTAPQQIPMTMPTTSMPIQGSTPSYSRSAAGSANSSQGGLPFAPGAMKAPHTQGPPGSMMSGNMLQPPMIPAGRYPGGNFNNMPMNPQMNFVGQGHLAVGDPGNNFAPMPSGMGPYIVPNAGQPYLSQGSMPTCPSSMFPVNMFQGQAANSPTLLDQSNMMATGALAAMSGMPNMPMQQPNTFPGQPSNMMPMPGMPNNMVPIGMGGMPPQGMYQLPMGQNTFFPMGQMPSGFGNPQFNSSMMSHQGFNPTMMGNPGAPNFNAGTPQWMQPGW